MFSKIGLQLRYYRVLSKALLGFSVPDKQPSMTAHYNRTKVELQRRVSDAGACRSVLGGSQGPCRGGGPNSAPPVAV